MDRSHESPAAMFKRTLQMEERLADALVAAEILSLEELAYVPMEELLGIQGVSGQEVQLFRRRAQELLPDVVGRAPGEGDEA